MKQKDSSSNLLGKFMQKCSEKLIPLVVQIELTYNCNLTCRHCNVVRKGDDELSTDEVKDIIDQLKEMGTFFLAFTGGEIFTRNDFLEIAWYAKRRGFILIFMTNATMITPEKMKEIKKIKPRNFEISLLGATPKTHDYITKADGSFQRTVDAIKELTGEGIDVTTKTALMSLNIREYEDIKALSKKLGAVPQVSPGITPKKDGSLEPQEYELSFEDLERYLPESPSDPTYFLRWESDASKSRICNAGRSSCSIAPNGDVFPCVLLPIKVGNLKRQSFKEIWHTHPSDSLKRLRKLTEKDLKECSGCDLMDVCHRCAGVAYLEKGDSTASSPSACRLAAFKKSLLGKKG